MKKTKLQKKKDNVSSTYWKKKADKEWSLRARVPACCAICGRSNVQLHAHHLIGKRAIFFRHDLMNGICLCANCHEFSDKLSAHGTPWAFEKWMKRHRNEQFMWWDANRWETIAGVKVDYKAAYERLKT